MDINLIKTFLEVAASGSFVHASERLFVTQSAVSLRIRRLEELLGQDLFTRSKAGAILTSAGQEFEGYALSLLKIWEESRQQIAMPPGFTESIGIGAQYSLWPRLGFRWIDNMRTAMPELSIRGEVDMPDRLTRKLIEGSVEAAILYTPQLRPGLTIRPLMSESLVMVASWPDPDLEDIEGRYAFIDWGPEFVHAHALHLPRLTNPGLTLALGALSADFIRNRQFAAYLPARYVKTYVDEGALFYVPDAPVFPYPIWSIWREDLDARVARMAHAALQEVIATLEEDQQTVKEELTELSEDGELEALGDVFSEEE